MLIRGSFDDFLFAKRCAIQQGVLVVDEQGPIPVGPTRVPGPYVVVGTMSGYQLLALIAFGNTITYRWMEPLQEWQYMNNLFGSYGPQEPEAEFTKIVNRFELQDYRMVDIETAKDYTISIEKINNMLCYHATVNNWNKDIKQILSTLMNKLQQDLYVDSYVYSIKPNKEYVISGDTTFKFAEMMGWKFHECVVLNDGFEHDIYKRSRDVIL